MQTRSPVCSGVANKDSVPFCSSSGSRTQSGDDACICLNRPEFVDRGSQKVGTSKLSQSKSLIIGLVPAKLSSVRLRRKNIADLGGVPLLSHSIRVARKVKRIDRVYVSSEAGEIEKTVQEEGCSFIHRDDRLSSPDVTNFSVMSHALMEVEKDLGHLPEFLVLLQPTHPFRDPVEIENGIAAMLANPEATCLIAVRRIRKPAARITDGWWDVPDNLIRSGSMRSEPIYINTGNFYIFRCAETISKGVYFGDRILPLEITAPAIDVDIDEAWDLNLARLFVDHGSSLLGLPETLWKEGPSE